MNFNVAYYRYLWGVDIGVGSLISFKANIDRTNPRGVHIGSYTSITFGSVILSHDYPNNRHVDTWIGDRCLIGAHSIVYPGVRIGNGCIVAAGSVVTHDVPDGCIVMGNPARVVEKGIAPGKYGIRVDVLPPHRTDRAMIA
jgi:acetyltransferase-like isoleucine patch superfamily enzyme